MEKYLVIREFDNVPAKSVVIPEGKGYRAYSPTGKKIPRRLKELTPSLKIHLLQLDNSVFSVAYNSLPYRSWLNEKASEIDEQGQKVYGEGLDRSRETLIMYLMDVGVSSDTLTRLVHQATGGHGLGVVAL